MTTWYEIAGYTPADLEDVRLDIDLINQNLADLETNRNRCPTTRADWQIIDSGDLRINGRVNGQKLNKGVARVMWAARFGYIGGGASAIINRLKQNRGKPLVGVIYGVVLGYLTIHNPTRLYWEGLTLNEFGLATWLKSTDDDKLVAYDLAQIIDDLHYYDRALKRLSPLVMGELGRMEDLLVQTQEQAST